MNTHALITETCSEAIYKNSINQQYAVSRAHQILGEHANKNSKKAFESDMNYWKGWFLATHFPVNKQIGVDEIVSFIIQHAEGLMPEVDSYLVERGYKTNKGPSKMSTIKRKLISMSVYLQKHKLPNPINNDYVRQLLFKLTRKYGGPQPRVRAITRDILDDMLYTCEDSLIDIRDRAMLLFCWGSGGRRASEVSNAHYENLTQTSDGDFTYHIPRSKTDQQGKGHMVPLKGRVARALVHWLEKSGITSGLLFRSISQSGRIGSGLYTKHLYMMVQRRLLKAGYDHTKFGAHSLRSGFVTEAGRRGKPLGDVMQMTTHKNVAIVMRYYQAGNIHNNSAAYLAE